MMRTNRKIVISSVIAAVVIGLFILYLTLVLTWNSYDKCDTGSLPHIFSTLQYNKTFTIYWDKPVCNVTFLLKYTIEDQPPILVYLSNTSWTVEEKLEPCDVVDVQLWAITKGELSESFVSDNFIAPKRLSAEYENTNVLLTWDMNNGECNFTYLLRYEVNNNQSIQINTTEFSHQVYNVEVCSVLQLNLWTIDAHGEMYEDYISRNYTAVPRNAIISDLRFSIVPAGVQVTWSKPPELYACDVFYDALYVTEFYTSPRVQIYSGNLTVPTERFCFRFSVGINVRVDDFISSTTVISYGDRDELENITLSVSSNNPNTLIVDWSSHPKQELCLLQYEVLYTPNEGKIQSQRVVNPETSFSFTYCDRANISISIIGPNSTISGSTTTVEATQYPKNIARVTDLTIGTNVESISLSWTPVPPLGLCEWSYEAKFWTDIGNFTYIAAISPIEFPENLYCFFIEVGVRTFYDDNHFSEMSTTHISYELEPVQNLKIIKPIENNILNVTWTGHRKQEQCDILYQVTYEHGAVQETITTSLTTMNFDIVYDVTINIRVKAISGDEESKESSISHMEVSPYLNERVTYITSSCESFSSASYCYVMLVTVILIFFFEMRP